MISFNMTLQHKRQKVYYHNLLSQPWLEKKFKIHDTCGVNNLHGIPGAMGTILSIIMAAVVNKEGDYRTDEK